MELFIITTSVLFILGMRVFERGKRAKGFSRSHNNPTNVKLFKTSQPKSFLPYSTDVPFPYELSKSLLTSREMDLYHMLRYILKNTTYFISIKPRIADFINVTVSQKYNTSVFWHYFNKISAKHVDFLICDEHMKPVLAVELDDSTHDMTDRIKRDEFINTLYNAVHLNVLHIKNYTLESVETMLSEFLPLSKPTLV